MEKIIVTISGPMKDALVIGSEAITVDAKKAGITLDGTRTPDEQLKSDVQAQVEESLCFLFDKMIHKLHHDGEMQLRDNLAIAGKTFRDLSHEESGVTVELVQYEN